MSSIWNQLLVQLVSKRNCHLCFDLTIWTYRSIRFRQLIKNNSYRSSAFTQQRKTTFWFSTSALNKTWKASKSSTHQNNLAILKYDMSNIYSVNLLSMESMSMPTKHTYSCLEILLMTARKSLNTCMLHRVGGGGCMTGRQGNSYCSNKLECLSSVLHITWADGQAWLTILALYHANKYTLWMETWASSFLSIITAGHCFSYSHLRIQTHL